MSRANKILGFDFGLKYIGVAFGQSITNTAKPIGSIKADGGEPNWDNIKKLIDEWQPDALVVGVPFNMDDTEQKLTRLARNFAEKLNKNFNLKVHEIDERLSTWEAKSKLKIPYKDNNVDKKKLNEVNAVAAAILVERWLQE